MNLLKSAAALLCAVGLTASASTSNAAATITDLDGQTWGNSTFTATLVTANAAPTIAGVPVSPLRVSGTLSAAGVLTATLTDTGSIDQKFSTWSFHICSNTSAPCVDITGIAVTGATPNLSTALSAGLNGPRFNGGPSAFGYLDAEVINPLAGSTYYNVTLQTLRQWNGTAWTGTGGSGTPNSGINLSTANVIAEFPILDGTGTSVADISGNGHTANFCPTTGAPSWLAGVGISYTSLTQCLNYTDSSVWGSTIRAIEIVYSQIPPGGSATHGIGPPQSGTFSCFMCASTEGISGTYAYVSGGTGCTNGTQTVTGFVGGTGATGTILVSGGIPTGNITIVNAGYGWTVAPTTAQVTSCTGLSTFSGGSLESHVLQINSVANGSGLNNIQGGSQASISGAGTHVGIIWTDGTLDHMTIDGVEPGYSVQNNTLFQRVTNSQANLTNLGHPLTTGFSTLLGGSGFIGNVYYVRFLSAIPPVTQDYTALRKIVENRGVSFSSVNTAMNPTMTLVGDSRTFGTGSNIPYGDYLNTYISTPYAKTNILGVAGFNAGTMQYYPPGRECLVSAVAAGKNDAAIWDGTNDVFGNVRVSTIWASIQSQAGQLRACGYRNIYLIDNPDRGGASAVGEPIDGVISYVSGGTACTNGTQAVNTFNGGGTGAAGTILVAGGVPTGTVTLTTGGANFTSGPTTAQVATCTGVSTFSGAQLAEAYLSSVERANWQQSFDGFADIATNALLAPNGTNSGVGTYYMADRTHFTVGGYTTVAQYLGKVVNASYGSTLNHCDPVRVGTTPYAMQDADGCKVFDSQAGASVVNLQSALGQTGRVIRICNSPSGAGASLTVNVATTIPTSNGTGTVASAAIPAPEFFNVTGTVSITVPVNSCKDIQSAVQSATSGGSYWQTIN